MGYFLTKVKKCNLNSFHLVTHYEIVNVGTKSHQIETDSYFSFFKISVLSVAFFWNRESFNKMFTQSAYVSFFLFYVSFFCSLNLCFLFYQFLLYIHNFIFLRLMV